MNINIKLKDYFSGQDDVVSAYVFGSFAKGKQNLYSDVDVAVLLDSKVDKRQYTDRQITIAGEISRILNMETDAIILNKAGVFLKFQIYKYGKAVYEKEKRESRAFKARSILEYFDFLPIKNALESRIIQKIKEA